MKSIWHFWQVDILLVLLTTALAAGYYAIAGRRFQQGAGTFFTGLILLVITESSPLHFLGMHYLFSAHMVVHVVILLLCAPLLVLGLPKELSPGAAKVITAFSRFLNRFPWLGWMAGIGIMWFWHIPAVFDAAFPAGHSAFSLLPLLHMGSLLLAGIIFSWPLLGPLEHFRLSPPVGVIYLFTACVGCSLLGLLLTFAPTGIYHHYLQADHWGYLQFIRQSWGISAQDDQQMAGLIMWVPCCFIYLAGSVYLLRCWLLGKEENLIHHTPIR